MIILQDDALVVRVDPRHGGEILDLVDRATGRQLLGRPPFAATEPVAGDLDEATWTAAYRGGWQLLAPNAGNDCIVGGAAHGFHGRASNDPWSVVDAGPVRVALQWESQELRITRVMELRDGALELETTFEARTQRVPFISVEHCALGLELLDPAFEIRLAGGRAYELSETSGPARPPADAPAWPAVGSLDGSREQGAHGRLADVFARFFAVADVPVGRADIVNARRGTGLTLEWDEAVLPHVWVWQEMRHSEGAWRRHGEIVAVEPASVPHSLGLATAIENDQAHWVEPGKPLVQRVSARPWRTPAT